MGAANMPVMASKNEVDHNVPVEVIQVYMDSLFRDMSKPQAMAFVRMANKKNLDWETRQIYPMKTKTKNGVESIVPLVSIDGFQIIADRTGKYGGIINSRLRVKMKSGNKVTIPFEEFDPSDVDEIISGTVEVVRKDFPVPQSATALFASYAKSYNGQPSGLWGQFPERMILKCAESLALRKAFPQDLSGLYSREEMEQAESKTDNPRQYFASTTVTRNSSITDVKTIQPKPVETKAAPVEEKKPEKKEKTIVELIEGIPLALRHRKADFDPDLFPFCEQFVLSHFGVVSAADIPEEKRAEVVSFLKNDLINHLTEHGEL